MPTVMGIRKIGYLVISYPLRPTLAKMNGFEEVMIGKLRDWDTAPRSYVPQVLHVNYTP